MPATADDPVIEGKCFGCRMPPFACFCAQVPRIVTRIRIVVIRHCAEVVRTSNTGRVVARALVNSALVDHGLSGLPVDLSPHIRPDAMVLFPVPAPSLEREPPSTLFVLDGSWSHARRMRWRIPAVAELPSLSLPAPAIAPMRIRRAPQPEQLATIEAVAAALDFFGEPGPAAELRDLFALMAGRMRDLRGFDMPPKR